MFRVKRLYTFVLQNFLPIFLMTFLICNFILVMQLLWRVAEQIMGKGIGISVYLEFFYYASAQWLPTTLPLAILLASLMTFGNFGERLELLAMKAAGVSLFNIMKPLIITVTIVACGSFIFQDKYLPKAQVKMQSLIASIQQKSPTLSIPEGAFYSEIEDMTIYVKGKDVKKSLLLDIMIYDFSQGFDDVAVTLADSGRLRMTEDKMNLVLTLYHGEGFSNFDQEQANTAGIPYRREMFRVKEMIIPFDANFTRVDESAYDNSHISMNTKELRHILDSVGHRIDSIEIRKQSHFTERYFMGRDTQTNRQLLSRDSISKVAKMPLFNPNVDSLYQQLSIAKSEVILDKAIRRVESARSDFEYIKASLQRDNNRFRRSGIEYYKKFSLAFACIIFFFIGAPLGAIIRKGGIGMPAVVSVVLFIAYYLVDTAGQKLVKSGEWEAIYGMSLSTVVLLPLGIFLTVKAVNDSTLFNFESYVDFVKKLLNIKTLWRYIRINMSHLFRKLTKKNK